MKINTIHNIFFYMAAALAIVNGLTACSDKDESFLAGTGSVLRSADEINLTSGGVAKVFTVCAKGEWSIETAASWLHFSKTSGTGDGNNREQILVSADHNISASRLDSFVLKAAGRELITRVTQAEGHATLLGEATLSSTLQAEKSLEGVSHTHTLHIRLRRTEDYRHANPHGCACAGHNCQPRNCNLKP